METVAIPGISVASVKNFVTGLAMDKSK